MFFQWNRFEKNHSYKEWGHFTSKDLLHWNWEGSALLPDQFYEQNGVYSGSALIRMVSFAYSIQEIIRAAV